jgi:hypothetical protein
MRGDESSGRLRAPAEHLAKLARDELGEMSTRCRNEGFLRLNARRFPARGRRGRAFNVAAVLALVTVVAVVLIGWHRYTLERARPLSYSVDGGRIDATGALATTGTKIATVSFSDGTTIAFREGARGKLKSVGEHGARVALSGKVDIEVVHWRGAHWLFDAGPFLITVKGTAFTVEWSDLDQRLEIALRTGAIAVSGPLSDEAISLRGGQRLVISTREKEVRIRDINGAPEPSVPPAASSGPQTSVDEPPAPERTKTPVAPSASASSRAAANWVNELAAGNFAVILQQAEQRGLDAALAEVSSAELAALADAARYSRRDEVARRALLAQRRRFPRSARANDAAFLLGRLEEATQQPEAALTWYSRCLDESPHGTYVSEALGRKMTLVQRVHGAAPAVPIAEEYLRRFGSGTYAAAARALIRAP